MRLNTERFSKIFKEDFITVNYVLNLVYEDLVVQNEDLVCLVLSSLRSRLKVLFGFI